MHRILLLIALLAPTLLRAADAPRTVPLALRPDDAIATGNEWLALPDIRATDGALMSFNALSMRDRGLLQASGESARPVLEPYFQADGKPLAWHDPDWRLLEYWIPQARQSIDGLELTLTWCAPNGSRAAFVRLTATNHRAVPAPVTLGVKASFGRLSRVTYVPVALRGERTIGPSPWVDPGEVFSYITHDTQFAWALVHPGSVATTATPPLSLSPEANAAHAIVLQPGESTEALYVLAPGLEEFSAAHNARALREMLDRSGSDAIIAAAAAWCRARTRTTGRADLDLLMNRNFLFTAMYAWGRTIDTEQLVGVTSRSPRYYVSAAYWDRDAMLWSFPGLLDIDPQLARDALEYALTLQLRNTGTHSRFIDGVVLEDGFQLDEAVAPLVALGAYLRATGDAAFVGAHREAIALLRDRLLGRYDAAVGLYSSLQDSQDEYQKLPFITYDNVLAWRALTELSALYGALRDDAAAADMKRRAASLHAAIMAHAVTGTAPGAGGTIFASATDGANFATTDIPPGSLMKLPALGFIAEDDPLFRRTYDWLHSPNYRYSYSDRRYGLPGSYRLPITTSWVIADELRLKRGHDRAAEILLASPWDGGIVSEGIDPDTARMDYAGRAFATAAGYVAHALCDSACLKR
ncbi:MAG TPA: glycoside hydrolase family 125 protein [Steroidobacteraceae bacterium]|nr:glycoside hydrolase family 125 protein [Steroidobacteraceae bacterium]